MLPSFLLYNNWLDLFPTKCIFQSVGYLAEVSHHTVRLFDRIVLLIGYKIVMLLAHQFGDILCCGT